MEKYILYRHISPSNKVYIGITSKKPEIRWGKDGNRYKENGSYFWNAIQKYGWENFKHEILFEGLTKEQACQKEIEFIRIHHSNNRNYGYNRTKGGDGVTGCKHSEETKLKLSEMNKGKKLSDETKRKIGEASKRRTYSEESKRKKSESLKGRKFSEESKRKMSIAKQNMSKVTKKKMSDIAKTRIGNLSQLYKEYKEQGGIMNWNEFQKNYYKKLKEASNG